MKARALGLAFLLLGVAWMAWPADPRRSSGRDRAERRACYFHQERLEKSWGEKEKDALLGAGQPSPRAWVRLWPRTEFPELELSETERYLLLKNGSILCLVHGSWDQESYPARVDSPIPPIEILRAYRIQEPELLAEADRVFQGRRRSWFTLR